MARKNRDIEILVKLASTGNFDAAQEQLERLKAGQESAAAGGAGAIGKLSAAWKAWTTTAQVSAGKIRNAFLTALGPIGALIVIVNTVISTFSRLISFAKDYQKAQEETNKTFAAAAAAIAEANKNKEKYADAAGMEPLNLAIKAHEEELQKVIKSHDEIAKKLKEQNEGYFGTLFVLASTTRAHQEQLWALIQQRIESERQLEMKKDLLEFEKELAKKGKEREEAEEAISDRLAKLTLNETELKEREIVKQLLAYEKAGADRVMIDRLMNAESDNLVAEQEKKREDANQRLASRVAQMTKDEVELARQKYAEDLAGYEELGLEKGLIDQFVAAESKRIGEMDLKNKDARKKKEETIEKERLAAARGALSDLATFQNSKNREMAAVGKAAAFVDNLIQTQLSATKAFSALASIPVVGPVLGGAAAAAAIAAGTARGAVIMGAPELEKGGVIEKDMLFRGGEKGRKEGVLPLEDPRAMRMVGEAISNAGGIGGGAVFHNTFILPGLEAARDPATARAILEILADQMERGGDPSARRAALTIVRRAEMDRDMAA